MLGAVDGLERVDAELRDVGGLGLWHVNAREGSRRGLAHDGTTTASSLPLADVSEEGGRPTPG